MIRRKGDKSGGPISKSKLGYLKSLSPVVLWAPVTGRTDLQNLANPGTHDATLTGDAAIGGESPLGQSLVVDGNDTASAAYAAALHPTNATYIVAVRNDNTAGGNIMDVRASFKGFGLIIRGGAANNTLRVNAGNGSGNTNVDGVISSPVGTYFTVAVTISGENIGIITNGVEDKAPTTVSGFTPSATEALTVGDTLTGGVAAFALFNSVLTTAQINRIHSDLLR